MNIPMSSPISDEQREALKKAIRAHGGQKKVASKAGVDQSTISKFLRGKNVMHYTAMKIFKAVGIANYPPTELKNSFVAKENKTTNYEERCMLLTREVTDQHLALAIKERELAALERKYDEAKRALGNQQDRILKAVQIITRRLGLSSTHALELTDAVGHYELIIAEEENSKEITSHQSAAGNGE